MTRKFPKNIKETPHLPPLSDDPNTQRLPGRDRPGDRGRSTDRLPGQAEKHRDLTTEAATIDNSTLENAAELLAAWDKNLLPTGDVMAGRFQVLEGPIGEESGEAQVYRCLDLETMEEVALKVYKANLLPKREVLENLVSLEHPSLVALRDFGHWDGRFYEVQEFCHGGCVLESMPFSGIDLENLVRPIISGLRFCHRRGVIHRDIKPSNLFYRDPQRKEPVIGDFGISSYLPEGDSQVTRTFRNFTIAYASPEQLEYRQVGSATDYYSLGITLVHLARGHSPFKGLAYHEIVAAHLKGKIQYPDGLGERVGLLLRGLLRKDPHNRWGYDQVMAWIQHEPILTREGLPDTEEILFDQELPYPACPEAKNPRQLARFLDRFDAADDLFRGKIALWVNFFNPDLCRKITDIEQNYVDRPELGLFKLRYLLDPGQPLVIGGKRIPNLETLAKCLLSKNTDLRQALESAFWDGFIDCWMEAAVKNGLKLARRIRNYRLNHENKAGTLGLFPFIYLLGPKTPLPLGSNVTVKHPDQLGDYLVRPEFRETLKRYLRTGRLATWLEIAHPEHDEDRQFVIQCAADYRQNLDLGVSALIWYFNPDHPFLFENREIRTPRELAAAIDQSPESWKAGIKLLQTGLIRTWLTATGMLSDPAPLDDVLAYERFSPDLKLDMVLKILDPDLGGPILSVDPAELDLGGIQPGFSKTVELRVVNAGRGQLSGRLYVEGAGNDVLIDPPNIEGYTLVRLKVAPASWLQPGVHRQATVIVQTNGGGREIPLTYKVVDQPPPSEPTADTLKQEKTLVGKFKRLITG